MNVQDALAQLGSDPANQARMATYHKVDRPYLGVPNAVIDAAVKDWRAALDLEARLALASALWDSNVHEGRIAAAKLLTQARIRPDDTAAWDLICAWVPDFDCWTIADQVAIAGQKRLVLAWAAQLIADKDFMIQSAIAAWLRDLSKHDHDLVAGFIETHGEDMKTFARKEASRHLG